MKLLAGWKDRTADEAPPLGPPPLASRCLPALLRPQAAEPLPHPNPATSTVTIAYVLPAGRAVGRVVLCDLRTGKAVVEQAVTATQSEATIPVAHLPAGLYVCRLEVAGRALLTRKVAILH